MGSKGHHPVPIGWDPFRQIDAPELKPPKPLPWYYAIDPMWLLVIILVPTLAVAWALAG